MIIKTEEQLQKMKEIGFICATIRDELVKNAVQKNFLKNMELNQRLLQNMIFQDIHVYH